MADLLRLLLFRKVDEVRDRSLQERDLAQVDERGQLADRAGREARAGTRRADDEDEPLLLRPAQPGLGTAHGYAHGGRAVR